MMCIYMVYNQRHVHTCVNVLNDILLQMSREKEEVVAASKQVEKCLKDQEKVLHTALYNVHVYTCT